MCIDCVCVRGRERRLSHFKLSHATKVHDLLSCYSKREEGGGEGGRGRGRGIARERERGREGERWREGGGEGEGGREAKLE